MLRQHCDNEGRDYETIEKTLQGRGDPIGNTYVFLANMEEYAALGIDLVEVAPQGDDPAAFIRQLGEKVVPRLAEMGT